MYRIRVVVCHETITRRPHFKLVGTQPQRATPRALIVWIGIIDIILLLGGFALFWSANAAYKDYVPIYPGAQDVKEERADNCLKVVTFRTDDPNDKITAFYEDELAWRGWGQPRDTYGHLMFSREDGIFNVGFKAYAKKEVRLSVGLPCWKSSMYQESETPTPKPPVVNITRKDYEEALAKWQASGIDEYEITVGTYSFLGGTRTLRVSDHGMKLLEVWPSPTPESTPDPEYIDYVNADTIEGMFAAIEGFLEGDNVVHSGAVFSTGNYYMAYTVEFDPDLGYPVYLSGGPITEPGVAVFDANWSKTVIELKIMKP